MYWGCAIKGRRPGITAAPERRSTHNHLAPSLAALLLTALACTVLNAFAGQIPVDKNDCALEQSVDPAPINKRIVIIIDDLGHNLRLGRQALALPGNLTYAVIPFTAHGRELAQQAHGAGKEVMLHAPMSTLELTPLGTGGLTPELSRQEFHETLAAGLENIPHVQGVNNHMGSDLTRRRQQMAWLMRELRWQDLYFVDSRTNKETVAATVAAEFNVPHLSRHVFLDNVRTPDAISERFEVLLEKAQEEGVAVAIGHPYPETIAFLRESLPLLHEQGVELIKVSEALAEDDSEDLAMTGPAMQTGAETSSDTSTDTISDTKTSCCPAC